MNLLLDFGNTFIKTAVADKTGIVEVKTHTELSIATLKKICSKYEIKKSILSSVVDMDKSIQKFLSQTTKHIEFTHKLKIPFKNNYKTPLTLGKDRLAAVAGAITLLPKRNLLVVDFGTAITYEIINFKGEYLGGNISPGLDTRFKALHHFTKKLPLEKRNAKVAFIGQSTTDAITSGVQQGIVFEVDSYIAELRKKMNSLAVVFTGGDAIFFEKLVKYPIFAEPDLVLIGLNRILEQNA